MIIVYCISSVCLSVCFLHILCLCFFFTAFIVLLVFSQFKINWLIDWLIICEQSWWYHCWLSLAAGIRWMEWRGTGLLTASSTARCHCIQSDSSDRWWERCLIPTHRTWWMDGIRHSAGGIQQSWTQQFHRSDCCSDTRIRSVNCCFLMMMTMTMITIINWHFLKHHTTDWHTTSKISGVWKWSVKMGNVWKICFCLWCGVQT